MSYIINKTDGSTLTEVVDGTVDKSATSLTLIGKNSSSYGEAFNENFVHMLENFARSTAPINPITGQLWFDTSDNRLKVYDGNGFKVSGGTIVASSRPSGLVQGDLWIDSVRQQLYFYTGTQTLLAGPVYNQSQGVSGFNIITVLDTLQKSHTLALLYVGDTLIGIFSKSSFTPKDPIAGFTGNIVAGFNIGNTSGLLFNIPVTTAYNLKSPQGELKTTNSFLPTDANGTTTGTLIVQNSTPLILGPSSNNNVTVDSTDFLLASNSQNQNISFKVATPTGLKGVKLYNPGRTILSTISISGNGTTATITFANQYVAPFELGSTITVAGVTPTGYNGAYTVTACTATSVSYASATTGNQTVAGTISSIASPKFGVFTDTPQAALDVNGGVLIRGDLTVLGTTTAIEAQNLQVADKNIELAVPVSGSASDTLADNGGITLKGTTDKTFSWHYSGVSSNTYWNSSENINLVSGKTFKINGVDVLSGSSLGLGISSAPGLTSLGALTSLQIGNLYASGSTITSSLSNGSINLTPLGSGTVDVSSSRITNVASPNTDTDAVNFIKLKTYVRTRSLGMVAEITDETGAQLSDSRIALLINEVYPSAEYDEGTMCRVHCTRTTVGYSVAGGNPISFTVQDSGNPNIRITRVAVDQNGGTFVNGSNVSVIQDVSANKAIDAGNALYTVARYLKIYKVVSNSWVIQSTTTSTV
jgi:hypothetical protein